MSNDSPLASAGSVGSTPRKPHVSKTPEVPALNRLAWTPNGIRAEDLTSLSVILAEEYPVCVISFAEFYHSAMDIHYVTEAHEMIVRRLTSKIVLLAKPGSHRFGNSPRDMRDALGRLDKLGIRCVYEPSDELVAFLGIGDNRGGIRNAMHRFQDGRLVRSWIAAISAPTAEHRSGAADILSLPVPKVSGRK